jgi:hypothetical protein
VEDEQAKRELFARMDSLLPDARFLASNTSSVPIMKLAAGTSKPERVLGLHFFNPVPVLPLVELVRSIMTSPETLETARTFAEQTLGKSCIDSQDRAGFVVNALLIPYLLSAIRMYESGFASREDIDRGMVQGCAHPMGPTRAAPTSSGSTPCSPCRSPCTRSFPRPGLGRARPAAPHGRGRTARAQVGPRVLRLLQARVLSRSQDGRRDFLEVASRRCRAAGRGGSGPFPGPRDERRRAPGRAALPATSQAWAAIRRTPVTGTPERSATSS